MTKSLVIISLLILFYLVYIDEDRACAGMDTLETADVSETTAIQEFAAPVFNGRDLEADSDSGLNTEGLYLADLANSSNQRFRYPLEPTCDPGAGLGKYIESGVYAGKYHTAQDCRGEGGTPVYAVADGKIAYSGKMNGYGWLIVIDHPTTDVYSLYGHMSTRRWKKLSGTVQYGEIIGFLGDDDEDGGEWAPHLHFGMRKGQKEDYPDSGDSRWMAGYTTLYPTNYGWFNPLEFLEARQEEYQTMAPSPPNIIKVETIN